MSDPDSRVQDSTINIVDALKVLKQPPPESIASIRNRQLVVLSFWLIVLLLGLPIWWSTTSVYRADLPYQQMTDWSEGRVSPLQDCHKTQRLTRQLVL